MNKKFIGYQNFVVMDFDTESINVYTNIAYTTDTEGLLKHLGHDINNSSYMWCEKLNFKVDENI